MTELSSTSIWAYSIGTVFTDSLWQGIIIGFSFCVGLLVLKPGDARSRYNLAVVALLALILWTGYDLVHIIQHGKQSLVLQTGLYTNLIKENSLVPGNTVIHKNSISLMVVSGFFHALYSALGKYYTLISPAWIIGIFILSIRMAGGLIIASRTRKQSVFTLPSSWYSCAEPIYRKLKIRQKILIKGSYKVSGPMVIGYFKPVILIPAAVICGLNYSEMEAILAHELAHIRRHDFLLIYIQHLAETILFYHPVTWLISSFLDKEREKCCDDIAVTITNNSLPFAKAITLMENNRVQKNMPAAMLIGHNNNLLLRIKRILDKGFHKSSYLERLAETSIIIMGLCFIFAFSGFAHKKSNGASSPNLSAFQTINSNNIMPVPPDTLKKFRETRTIEAEMADDSTHSTTSYKITYENDSVKDLYVNKKKISRDQQNEFRKKLDELKKLRMEEAWNNDFQGWKDNKQMKALLDMAMRQSKHAMEEAMVEMQMNKENLRNELSSADTWMKKEKMFKELQDLQSDKLLNYLTINPGDSCIWNSADKNNNFFPKINEKEVLETKRQMEKLQIQLGDEMMKFQEEFQRTHGKMMDSLKREMEKLQKSLPLWQNGAFFNSLPNFNFPDFHFDNAFLMPGQLPDLWKSEATDSSNLEEKLRSLEK
jgi:bla regulator protein blaR1